MCANLATFRSSKLFIILLSINYDLRPMTYLTCIIHQLKEMSEEAVESMPMVNEGVQVVGCRLEVVEVSQVFLDLTKSTLF